MTTATCEADVAAIDDLARQLVAELAHHVAEPDAVNAALRAWLDDLGGRELGFVAAAAVRLIFAECLTTIPGPATAGAAAPSLLQRTA